MPFTEPVFNANNADYRGEAVLIVSGEDVMSANLRFSLDYQSWGAESQDSYVQMIVDYIAAAPFVSSVSAQKDWGGSQMITATEEPTE